MNADVLPLLLAVPIAFLAAAGASCLLAWLNAGRSR
jgi:hypothetical protein